jgi:fermentation-respiration switch protein FrsA (DUF1100 family)
LAWKTRTLITGSSSSEDSPRTTWRRTLGRLLSVVVGGYLTVLLLLMLMENYLLYPAPRYPLGDWSASRIAAEDVYFDSDDGTPLHGWFLDHPQPRGYLLYCHGNGEHVAHLAELLLLIRDDLGFAVFAFDYRGYGRSEGSPHEKGILADARAAHRWLTNRARISSDQLVIMGRSLGGAVAVDLAADYSARALVLESTFTSLPDVAARIYWWAPVRWLMRSRFDSLAKIARFSGPLLQSHGTLDEVVPIGIGRQLFASATGQQKTFVEFPLDGHNDPPPASYYRRLDQFLGGERSYDLLDICEQSNQEFVRLLLDPGG